MSGHSHAANIKHKKAASDARKGREFSRWAKAIMVAVRNGGPEPDANLALKYALEKARACNMPKDTIQRAIDKGSGKGEGGEITETVFEAIGPGGVSFLVECVTDNRNRTGPEIRKLFEQKNGKVGGAGSVAWKFEKKGVITIAKDAIGEDDLMTLVLDAGAEDMQTGDGVYTVTTTPSAFWAVKKALDAKSVKTESAELATLAKNPIDISDPKTARKVLELVEAIEEHEDVQNVAGDYQIADAVAAAAKAESAE